MSVGASVVTVNCLPLREYFSVTNMKSIVRGFVYEYETPKIVTIHSISSTFFIFSFDLFVCLFFSFLVALMCRLIQLLILVYGVFYLMIHKKGYQETDTSIISSITLKVKVKTKGNVLIEIFRLIS